MNARKEKAGPVRAGKTTPLDLSVITRKERPKKRQAPSQPAEVRAVRTHGFAAVDPPLRQLLDALGAGSLAQGLLRVAELREERQTARQEIDRLCTEVERMAEEREVLIFSGPVERQSGERRAAITTDILSCTNSSLSARARRAGERVLRDTSQGADMAKAIQTLAFWIDVFGGGDEFIAALAALMLAIRHRVNTAGFFDIEQRERRFHRLCREVEALL